MSASCRSTPFCRRVYLGALECTMLGVALTGCATTEPGPPESRIVFRGFGPEAVDLYSVRPDGMDLRQLTRDVANEDSPTWSRDGRQIAYAAQVAEDSRRDIYIINADGSGRRRLTSTGATNENPEWSPDGSRIAFDSWAGPGPVAEGNRVWVMQANGSGRISLAPGVTPSWSPDSRRLVFRGLIGSGPRSGLAIISSDGTGEFQLTDPGASVDDLYPEWSPDGNFIAFTRVVHGSPGTWHAGVWLIQPDGTGLKQLTAPLIQAYQPTWSPDGTEIVFSDGDNGQLKGIRPEDPATIRFLGTRSDLYYDAPAWGPER